MESFDQSSRWEKVALACGIIFVLLLAASAFLIPSPPGSSGGSAADDPAWLAQHGTAVMTQVYLRGLAAAAEVVFVVGLVTYVGRMQSSLDVPAFMALAGGISHGLLLVVSNMFTAAAADAGQGVSSGVIRTLGNLSDKTLDVESFLLAVLFAGASLALLRTRAVPRWIGWLALLAAVVAVVEPLELVSSGLDFLGFPALLLELVWFLATSIALLVHGRREQAVAEPRASAT